MDKKVTLSTKANAVGRTAVVPSKSKTFLDAMGAFGEALQTGTQVLQAENEEQFKRGLEQAAAGYSEEGLPRNSKAYARGYMEYMGKADAARLADVAEIAKQESPDNPELWEQNFRGLLEYGQYKDMVITNATRLGSETYRKHFQTAANNIANQLKLESQKQVSSIANRKLEENTAISLTYAIGNYGLTGKNLDTKTISTIYSQHGRADGDKLVLNAIRNGVALAGPEEKRKVLDRFRTMQDPQGNMYGVLFAAEFANISKSVEVKSNSSTNARVQQTSKAVAAANKAMVNIDKFKLENVLIRDDDAASFLISKILEEHPEADSGEVSDAVWKRFDKRQKEYESGKRFDLESEKVEISNRRVKLMELAEENKMTRAQNKSIYDKNKHALDLAYKMTNLDFNRKKLVIAALQDNIEAFNRNSKGIYGEVLRSAFSNPEEFLKATKYEELPKELRSLPDLSQRKFNEIKGMLRSASLTIEKDGDSFKWVEDASTVEDIDIYTAAIRNNKKNRTLTNSFALQNKIMDRLEKNNRLDLQSRATSAYVSLSDMITAGDITSQDELDEALKLYGEEESIFRRAIDGVAIKKKLLSDKLHSMRETKIGNIKDYTEEIISRNAAFMEVATNTAPSLFSSMEGASSNTFISNMKSGAHAIAKNIVRDFLNDVEIRATSIDKESGKPYSVTITEDNLNKYISSKVNAYINATAKKHLASKNTIKIPKE